MSDMTSSVTEVPPPAPAANNPREAVSNLRKKRSRELDDAAGQESTFYQRIFRLGDAPNATLEEQILSLVQEIKGEANLQKPLKCIVGCALVLPHLTGAFVTMGAMVGGSAEEMITMANEEVLSQPILVPQFLRFLVELSRVKLLSGLDEFLLAVNGSIYAKEQLSPCPVAFEDHFASFEPVAVDGIIKEDFKIFLRKESSKKITSLDYPAHWAQIFLSIFDTNVMEAARFILKALPPKDAVSSLLNLLLRQTDLHEHEECKLHAVLVHACRADRVTFPPALAKALRESIRDDQEEVRFRLAKWFAFHLSNFDFKWMWEEWLEWLPPRSIKNSSNDSKDAVNDNNGTEGSNDDVAKWPETKESVFLQVLLDQLARLSYADRLKAALPAAYHPYIPCHDVERDAYKYSGKDTEIMTAIRASDSTRLSSLMAKESDAVIQGILFAGSKTLSHTMAILEKHTELLKSFQPPEKLLESVLDFFGRKWVLPAELVCQKLIDMDILTVQLISEKIETMQLTFPPFLLQSRIRLALKKKDFQVQNGQ